MTQSDLEVLLEMGFDKSRAELAVKKSGGLQGALEWLEKTQDTPLEELQNQTQAAGNDGDDDEEASAAAIAALESGQTAKSLVCNECGKKFRSQDAAEFHATKSGHTDFAESTEEIAPLTEEQKKAKLEELRQKLKDKKANQAVQDQEDAKKNEKIRMKSTRETQDLKEEKARQEQIKEAAKKRAEKAADLEAKKRIKAKIEADKEERRLKAEAAKAAREGKAQPAAASTISGGAQASTSAAAAAAAVPKPTTSHNEARIRFQMASGSAQKSFGAETTLFEVAQALEAEHGITVTKFEMTFPRKVFEGTMDFSKTLREAGLVPSAVLRVM